MDLLDESICEEENINKDMNLTEDQKKEIEAQEEENLNGWMMATVQ